MNVYKYNSLSTNLISRAIHDDIGVLYGNLYREIYDIKGQFILMKNGDRYKVKLEKVL